MLTQKALSTVSSKNMIGPGEKVIVGVSGGPDSVALLHFLVTNYPKNKFHVCHLNHRLRGGDSGRDALLVKKTCSRLKIPGSMVEMDIAVYAKKNKLSLEEAGRIVRYDFFEKTAAKVKAKKIALAHTADDNIETFLMRLVRGSGIKGFCGIPPVNGNIIRPLIDAWKSEVIEYCQDNELEYNVDKTNLETKQFRNKIRNELIPILWKYNPNIKEVLINTINILSEDFDYISQKAFTPSPSPKGRGGQILMSKLAKLHPALKTQIVRSYIEKVKGNLKEVSYKHIRDILKLKEGQIHLPGGLFAVVKGGRLTVSDDMPKDIVPGKFSETIKIPGKSSSGVKASFVNKVPAFSRIKKSEAYIDASKLKGRVLTVRNFKEGDSFIPLGMKGHKKLHDLFIDEKVPVHMRALVPIVCDEEKILWVAGLRLDERAKTGRNTKKILRLSID
ncbi:MAG: tRNA lysidine(34) synthetase TilS [Candidatus Margulisiibacteriota bacterium]